MGIKNKKLGLFGSYSWNGGGLKNLIKFAEEAELEPVAEPAEIYGKPSVEKLKQFDELAVKMAASIKS